MSQSSFWSGNRRSMRRTTGRQAPVATHTDVLDQRILLSAANEERLEADAVAGLRRAEGFLQQPGGSLSGPSNAAPLDIARSVLVARAADLGVKAVDLASLRVSDVTKASGATIIYFRQQHQGIDIDGTSANVTVAADGRVLSIGNRLVSNVAGRVSSVRNLAAADAVAAAASFVGVADPQVGAVTKSLGGAAQSQVFAKGNVSKGDVPTKLVYQLQSDGQLRLSWNLNLQVPGSDDWFDMNVDASSGKVLSQSNWTTYSDAPGASRGGTTAGASTSFATTSSASSSSVTANGVPNTGRYNVYQLPIDAPNDGNRALIIDPADPIASPFGWHDTNGVLGAESTLTRGNNVSAQEDRDANNSGGFQPNGGAGLVFDFPIDPTQDPVTYESAVITQLFFTNNVLHDIHYQYGFDEASGNFQLNNYGNGGLGNDAVQADAQDGSGTNNANFSTPPDGTPGRMQQFLFDITNPRRDSDLDNGIIIHEYGHGVSNRLTGGPANSNALDALQSGGMGEGWSDFWGLMFTQRATDQQNDAFGLGTYVLGEPVTGGGIRRFPYSFDMSVNPLTFGDFNTSNEVHDAGEIWCAALWDLNWLLIAENGFDADLYAGTGGNNLMLQLVMDGLKLQPANPSFLDARDAIIQADQNLTGGANFLTIWTAFARRGMGFSADDGGSSDSPTVTEAFDLPATSTGVVLFDQDSYVVGEPVGVTVRDLDLTGPTLNLTVTSSGGDSENVVLARQSAGIYTGSINTNGAAPNPNNGTLQTAGGNTLNVTYNDADDGTGAPAVVTDVASVGLATTVFIADFNDASGQPALDGFTIDNDIGSLNQGEWHQSTGRGADPGHSSDDSLYYGTGEDSDGGGTYGDSAGGQILSPVISVPVAEAAELRFNHFLETESSFDFASVLVSVDGGAFSQIARSEIDFPPVTGGFVPVQIDITPFVGHDLQFAFQFTTDGSVVFEGWYVDDVEVRTLQLNFGRIAGTVFDDVDGDGTRDVGEAGLPNQTVYIDANGNGVFDPGASGGTVVSTDVPVTIPISGLVTSTTTVSGVTAVSDLDLGLDITHDFTQDLDIFLISPQGTRVELVSDVSGANYTQTIFDDEATTPIASSPAPHTGRFRPFGLLSDFDGEDPNGVWTLEITDDFDADGGTLNAWSLTFASTGDPSQTTDAQGQYAFSNLPPGPYAVRQVPIAGATQSVPVSGVYNVALTQNQQATNLDFGNFTPPTSAPQISGIGSVSYTENASPRQLAPTGTVSDIDSSDFAGGVLTIRLTAGALPTDRLTIRNQGTGSGQIGVSGSNITFGGTAIASFSGGTGAAPLAITFNANSSPARAQALLRNILYQNLSDNPTNFGAAPARTVEYVLSDGDGFTSAPVNQTVDVIGVNDKPSVAGVASSLTYSENAAARVLAPQATLADVDSADFAAGRVMAQYTAGAIATDRLAVRNQGTGAGQIGVAGNNVTFGGTLIGTITGTGVGTAALIVTLNSAATPTAVRALFRNLTYRNISNNATNFGANPARSLKLNVTDGDGGGVNVLQTIDVIAVNDGPSLSNLGAAVTYTENGTGNLVARSIVVQDADSRNLQGGRLTVSLPAGGQGSDRLAIRNVGNGPGQVGVAGTNVRVGGTTVGSFTGGAGFNPLVVTLNANATPATVQAIARNVLFSNISDNPSTNNRTVRFRLTDGDGGTSLAADKSILVVARPDAPAVTNFGAGVAWTEGATGVRVSPTVNVADADSPNLSGGYFTAKLTAGGQAADRLTIRNEGTAEGQISTATVNGVLRVSFGAIQIGSQATSTGGMGTSPLTINLNASANAAAVRALARNILFSNVSDNPSNAPRTVQFQLNDGDGGTSVPVTKSIAVVPVNDAPVVANFTNASTYAPFAGPTILDTDATVRDADSANFAGGTLTLRAAQGGAAGDVFGVRNQGSAAGQIGVLFTDVRFGGVSIGTIAAAGGTLTINLKGTATPAAVQALVRNLTYRSTSFFPTGPKTLQLTLTDGDGGTTSVSKPLNIAAGATAPASAFAAFQEWARDLEAV